MERTNTYKGFAVSWCLEVVISALQRDNEKLKTVNKPLKAKCER